MAVSSTSFKPGNPGRPKGIVNAKTALARAGVQSAIETCREGGLTPIQIMMESSRILHALGRHKGGADITTLMKLSAADLAVVVDLLVKASDIAKAAAQYAFPKLAHVDYVGDVPSAAYVENRMVVTLNIPPPGSEHRTTVDDMIAGDEDAPGGPTIVASTSTRTAVHPASPGGVMEHAPQPPDVPVQPSGGRDAVPAATPAPEDYFHDPDDD